MTCIVAALIGVILIGVNVHPSHSFRLQVPSSSSPRFSFTLNSLLKKGKLKEINTFLENISQEEVLQNYLKTGQQAFGIGTRYDFFNSTLNRFNSITIMVLSFLSLTPMLIEVCSLNTTRRRKLDLSWVCHLRKLLAVPYEMPEQKLS